MKRSDLLTLVPTTLHHVIRAKPVNLMGNATGLELLACNTNIMVLLTILNDESWSEYHVRAQAAINAERSYIAMLNSVSRHSNGERT